MLRTMRFPFTQTILKFAARLMHGQNVMVVRTTKKIPRILWNWWWNEKRIRYTSILFLVFLNENYMTQRTKTITHYQNANLLLENLSSESNLFETLVWRLLLLLLVVGGYFCLFLHLTNALLLFIFVPWSQSKCVFYKHTFHAIVQWNLWDRSRSEIPVYINITTMYNIDIVSQLSH